MLAGVVAWVAIGAVMLIGLFLGSHIRAERRPKDYPATAAAVRWKLRRQCRGVRVDPGPDGRVWAQICVEIMLLEVNTALTPPERERLVDELADELQRRGGVVAA